MANDAQSGTVSVLLGDGSGGFAARSDYATGAYPRAVAVGDFNGDGDARPGGGRSGEQATVSVLLGDGTGGFVAKSDYGTGSGPDSVAVADFNGDGAPDLATANAFANTVSVLLGDGTGGFGAKIDYATGYWPRVGRRGRLQRRRHVPDLATANLNHGAVSVLLGDGTGGFTVGTEYAAGPEPNSLAVGDFNGDGLADLAVANYWGPDGTVSVLLGDGTGGFAARAEYAAGDCPDSVGVGDFNGDGRADLAVANMYAGTVSVLLGTPGAAVAQEATADGVWYFHVRAVDGLGDGGPTATVAVRIDSTAPVTSDDTPAGWQNHDVTVTLTADDGMGSGVAYTEFTIGSGDWTKGTSVTVPAPADHSGDGIQTVSYYSVDNAGNTEEARSCQVKIDTTPPVISVAYLGYLYHGARGHYRKRSRRDLPRRR